MNGLVSPQVLYSYVIRALVMLIVIPFHEAAHALVSWKLGDSTAKDAGRLSLNPVRHFDPLGALCMVVGGVGWAKPVGINPGRFKAPKRGMALSAAAGPAANFLMAFAGLFGIGLIYKFTGGYVGNVLGYFYTLLNYFVVLNVGLGVFNLIPVPPLDGSKAFGILAHNDENYMERNVNRNGYIVLALLAVTGLLSIPMRLAQNAVVGFLYAVVRFLLHI